MTDARTHEGLCVPSKPQGRPLVRRVQAVTRSRRFATLLERFPDLGAMSVLDLGGSVSSWELAPVHPGRLVTVNLESPGPATVPWATAVEGDACSLPEPVRAMKFDLVFSNSVIEHLGGHAKRLQFAEVVRSSAPNYWVQAPYRYFPIEPHWLFPGFQFLPVAARLRIARHWPPVKDRIFERDVSEVFWIDLPSRSEIRHYFPDGELLVERFAGLPKSLIAVR